MVHYKDTCNFLVLYKRMVRCFKLADDTKILKPVGDRQDSIKMQMDLDNIIWWTDKLENGV